MADEREPGVRAIGGRVLAAALGPIGVSSAYFHALSTAEAADILEAIEGNGVRAVWSGEGSRGKEAFSHAAVLLASSTRLIIATGIANIWARDAVAMAGGTRVLGEAYPGRFVLGVGISHAPNVEARGNSKGTYNRPLARMRDYLDQMDAVELSSPEPSLPVPRVLGASGPKMLHLAAERAHGAHTYFVTVEHTATAREILGTEPVLAPVQAVVVGKGRENARAVAHGYVASRLQLEPYRNEFLARGFGEADLAGGGSDRLFDTVVAWGGEDAIVERVNAHRQAGADHVAIDILVPKGEGFPIKQVERLAALLAGT